MTDARKPVDPGPSLPEVISERRRAARFRPGPLRVQLENGPAGTIIDLSELGALLVVPEPQSLGSLISFDLRLAEGDVRLHGHVVRCSPSYEEAWRLEWAEPSSYRLAVDFFDLDARCRTTLQELFLKAGRETPVRRMVSVPASFETARLRMRAPRLADADAVFAYGSHPDVTRYMDWTRAADVAEVRALIERWRARIASGEEYTWLLTDTHADTPIGGIGCRLHEHKLDFGYVLQRQSWGQGLATEAARALVSWAFTLPQVYRVWATCDAENIASARVLEKAGLLREGVLRRWTVRPQIGPEPRDAFVYAKVR